MDEFLELRFGRLSEPSLYLSFRYFYTMMLKAGDWLQHL